MRHRERGAGNLGCIVGLVVFALAIIVAIKAIPPKIAVAEYKDYCVSQAESASLPRMDDKLIAFNILTKAEELGLPVTAEMIKVRRDSARCYVKVEFTVVIEFPLYTYNWDVKVDENRLLF